MLKPSQPFSPLNSGRYSFRSVLAFGFLPRVIAAVIIVLVAWRTQTMIFASDHNDMINAGNVATPVTTISAASFELGPVAPEEIVAAFGESLATRVEVANTIPLSSTLAGTRVKVRDSAGAERFALLFFVSPLQVNCQIP